MKKNLSIVLALALIGAGVAGWAMSASAKQSAPQAGGVKYYDHTTSSHYIDVGNSGFSAGDEFTFHDVLRQNGPNGPKKGTVDGFCKLTQLHPNGFEVCPVTAKIGDSQLELQLGGPSTGNKPFKVGINGGTGQYRTARGYVLVKPINQNNSWVTVYVMP